LLPGEDCSPPAWLLVLLILVGLAVLVGACAAALLAR
jgi:hypothetical protein